MTFNNFNILEYPGGDGHKDGVVFKVQMKSPSSVPMKPSSPLDAPQNAVSGTNTYIRRGLPLLILTPLQFTLFLVEYLILTFSVFGGVRFLIGLLMFC